MKKKLWGTFAAASLAAALASQDARACGGFFCSQSQGVNQAAERIVFAHNSDGTVTAVIEIQYQGPSDKFSWLLPISSVPMGDEIAVGSGVIFQRLQQQTNPRYSLTTRVEGTCDPEPLGFGTGGSSSGIFAPGANAGAGGAGGGNGVTVEATGTVGSFEWAVISFDQSLEHPADAAVIWLEKNGYDVPEGAPALLGPYLADGMNLLALRLQKGADAGSIRPIALTYEATKPMIPIKLTAVAANDDMGVLTWVLGDARAVPQNYYALELNEARINWFNANSNYNQVVTAAANEAGGQGFVTEFAGSTASLAGQLWTSNDEANWESVRSNPQGNLLDAIFRLSPFDGFWDAVRQHVQLQNGITVAQLQADPQSARAYPVTPELLAALEKDVIEPARLLQKLFDAHPQVTRLYSTLSAPEMTVDPLFTFNPTLPAVSNVHQAERVIECAEGYTTSTAPWRIELPQGGVVRGGPTTVGQWPVAFADQPANRRVVRAAESGSGKVVEDNSAVIDESISTYSASVAKPPKTPDSGSAGSSAGTGGTGGMSNNGAVGGMQVGPAGGGGCSIAGFGQQPYVWLGLASALVLWSRRRLTRAQKS
jgi:hypothetical protein